MNTKSEKRIPTMRVLTTVARVTCSESLLTRFFVNFLILSSMFFIASFYQEYFEKYIISE